RNAKCFCFGCESSVLRPCTFTCWRIQFLKLQPLILGVFTTVLPIWIFSGSARFMYATSTLTTTISVLAVEGEFSLYPSEDVNVVKSPYKNVTVPNVNIVDFTWNMVDKVPDKTALAFTATVAMVILKISGLTNQKADITYAHIMANGIKRQTVDKLPVSRQPLRMPVVLPNTPEFPLVFFGAIRAGLIVTTVNPVFTPDEIVKQLRDSGAVCMVTIPEIHGNVHKAVKIMEAERRGKIPIIVTAGMTDTAVAPDGSIKLEDMTSSSVDVSGVVSTQMNSEDVVCCRVRLSHRNLITNCLQIQDEPQLCAAIKASGDFQEVVPALLPFYHIYGMVALAIASLHFGSKIVTVPKFEPVHFITTIVKQKATLLYLVPPLIQFMASHPDVKSSYFDSVRVVNNGAAPVGPNDVDRLLKKAPQITFSQGYGLTETSPVCSLMEKGSKKYMSSGKPLPSTEMKVINRETGVSLGPDEPGEVCVRGPQVMLGYHNNPQATAETIDSAGWLHTGDMGYYDKDNDFYIIDRYKELIKVKGLQVAPAELEDILRSHPGVTDAAVIGIPDERKGEVPRAYIVLKDSKLSESEVKKFVSDKVSEHKQLAGGVEFVDAIPKNPSGKILRRKLKELYNK
ncbi:hypothetical protein L9F63_016728, partial [Diploptera punctata]